MVSKTDILGYFNGFAGFGHLTSAVALVSIMGGSAWEPALEFSYEDWIRLPAENCSAAIFEKDGNASKCFNQERVRESTSLNILWMAFTFAAWSGVIHLYLFTSWFFPKASIIYRLGWGYYIKCLDEKQNPFRWIDYMLSSPLMAVVIAVFSGVGDVFALSGIFFNQTSVIVLGWMIERSKNIQVQWLLFILAFLLYSGGVWAPMISTFYVSMENSSSDASPVVYAIFWSLFLVFTSFSVVMIVDIATKRRIYKGIECAYQVLSLVSKTLLHWTLATSVFVRSDILSNAVFSPSDTSEINMQDAGLAIGLSIGIGVVLSGILSYWWPKNVQPKTGLNIRLLNRK
jgi:hypothetical protein